MEDEIDLSKYLHVLLRHWKLIAGLALISAVVALVVSFLMTPSYEATALIAITRPQFQLQFDSRIPTLPEQQQPYKAFPELALSDGLLKQVMTTVGTQLKPEDHDLTTFQKRFSAEAGADPSLVRLSVTGTDPQRVQTIANTWAELYVTYANELYRKQSSNAAFFETQATEARNKLDLAEQALIDYQAHNTINIVGAQLAAKQVALSGYYDATQSIPLIIQDARSLQQQLLQQNGEAPVTLADELSALYLQVDALNLQTAVPIQLQVASSGSLTSRTVGEQAALLDALTRSLQDKLVETQRQVAALQPDILALQKEQQAAQANLDRLTRDRDVARDTYLALTRKLDETRVAAQDGNGGVQLASLAAVPTEPVAPRKGLNAILGGMLGLVLGVIGAFAIDTRRTSTKRAAAAAAQTQPA
ncbi:Tyrosine-protein kinase etk [Thermoflexales bacterium]|nr:Tyrosine-protein kinase etk [Thermoflexales bacterium]